jgi:uncharacterized protein with PIN domain
MDQHREATLRSLHRELDSARDDKKRAVEIRAEIERIEGLPEPAPRCPHCGRVIEADEASEETAIQEETRRRQAEFERVQAGGAA